MDIAIDFDGTVVSHDYPRIGKDIGAVPVLKQLVRNKHNLILFTMRSGTPLQEAIEWFRNHDIPLAGIQYHPTQTRWTSSNKCYAQLYIDDAALGCPVAIDPEISDRPFVNWLEVHAQLILKGLIATSAS